jgi:CHASE3 domain sensor protein
MRYPFSLRLSGLRIVLLGVLPGLTLLGAFIFLAQGSDRLEERRILIRQNNDVLSTADAIGTGVRDAERGQRGFLLTGNDLYLTPYTGAIARIPKLISKLQG